MIFSICDLSAFNESTYIKKNQLLFNTLEWLNFIKNDKSATPVLIKIENDNSYWYFPCLIFKKGIFSFLGSPFSGWSTPYMDLIGDDPIPEDLYVKLIKFLKKKFHPILIEILHSKVTDKHIKRLKAKKSETLILDIEKDEDDLFKNFKQDTRRNIKQFEKRGARLEVVKDYEGFAEIFYNQLIDVFAKQKMLPTYSKKKVQTLINELKDTNNLFCLKVMSPNDECIASSIFIGYGDTFYFWGGASYREHQHFRPNEYMFWYAIRFWKNKGYKKFDMVGVRDYKKKFNPEIVSKYRIYGSILPLMVFLRNVIERVYYWRLKRGNIT